MGIILRTEVGEMNALDRDSLNTLFPWMLHERFFWHRPPLYTTVTEPALTPVARESNIIDTQPKTTKYRKDGAVGDGQREPEETRSFTC